MELKISRRKTGTDYAASSYGVAESLEIIAGTYDGPEGKAKVDIEWNPKTGTYYKLEISANTPSALLELLSSYFGITRESLQGQTTSSGGPTAGNTIDAIAGGRVARVFPRPDDQRDLPGSTRKLLK